MISKAVLIFKSLYISILHFISQNVLKLYLKGSLFHLMFPWLGNKGSLLRGVLHFMTTEREHSSLIGIYVREFHITGFQRLKVLEQGRLTTSLKGKGANRNLRGLDAKTEHSLNLWATGAFLRSYYSHR